MIYNKIQYIMSIKVVVVMEGLTALCGEWRRLSGDESPSWLLYTLGLVFKVFPHLSVPSLQTRARSQ